MIHAYTEQYLHDSMINLVEAFDYAVNACKMKADAFMELFIASGYADKFGKGNPKVISGFSGSELVMEVCLKSGIAINFPEAQIEYAASAEYWSGWILAFYQWYTDQSFKDIHANISMIEVLKMYSTHHEAAEEKFLYTVNAILRRKKQTTKLQAQRKTCGYSQRELAEKSGVNLRTLQQYELGTKEIGKASVRAVASLANALGCRVEDLLETVAISEE